MMTLLVIIGFLLAPQVYAEPMSLYDTIKTMVELESQTTEAELAVQRFAVGIYYDFVVQTRSSSDNTVPFEMENEDYVDYALQERYEQMCGDQEDRNNDRAPCHQAQEVLREIVERNAWVRTLGRDLQAITSGYEAGIDGYPGKSIDIMSKFAGINHIWRATNDPFVTPILEKLTKARPWPELERDAIRQKAAAIESAIEALEKTYKGKKDRTELTAAMWRYRHGVRYVKDHEGQQCENRWCAIEEAMEALLESIQKDPVDTSADEQVIYPSYINKEKNIVIWMRHDDIGLQWYLPIEPMQATLYSPDYEDCIEKGDIRSCYEKYTDALVRGGTYPSKLGEGLEAKQLSLMGGGTVSTDTTRQHNAVVQEPGLNDGICSHPFSKRGYLCRTIQSESCTVTSDLQDQLKQAGTGGIVLTRCEPEQYKDAIATRTSGSDICDIGGWREQLENPEAQSVIPYDTPEKQDDMLPPPCARCVVDVECSDSCDAAQTSVRTRNGVIDICMPNNPQGKGEAYYTLMHEMTHAMQLCGQSNVESQKRIDTVQGCCAMEREGYLVQCKLMALDGILERAGVSIDACASYYANTSCSAYGDNACTSGGMDTNTIIQQINDARDAMADQLDVPSTCAEALEHPRVKAIRNSLPASCEPGCQLQYANTIGNNLCYTGQCIEETHERARDIPGRIGLTTLSQSFPWDACENEDPQIGALEVPSALTGPVFPSYQPERIVQELDQELCQINGLPASTPPIICGFDPIKRLGLPPISLVQSATDLALQPQEYDATGLNIQFAASAIASRETADMFAQYLRPAAQNFADLLSTIYDIFNEIGEMPFPSTMCPRFAGENFSCNDLQ
ncbi:hypothetical protein H6770_01615 [Candidatus Peribacteria bacterium]|nr:hypothetical protein [Candidatus Peribacteria bacterium]